MSYTLKSASVFSIIRGHKFLKQIEEKHVIATPIYRYNNAMKLK